MEKLKQLKSKGALTLGLILFDKYELLDVFGPYELLSLTGMDRTSPIKLSTIAAATSNSATASMGPTTLTDYCIYDENLPNFDIVFIPGGYGTRALQNDAQFVEKLKQLSEKAVTVFTVCTGSMLLAATGLLDGLKATTNKLGFQSIQQQYSTVDWIQQSRWEVDGKFFTSSGVSAGLDLANYFIGELYDKEFAKKICNIAEYVPNENPRDDPFEQVKERVPIKNKRSATVRLAVLVYENFEMLDTFGPLEMFGMLNKVAEKGTEFPPFTITFVGETKNVKSSIGPLFEMDKTFDDDHSSGYDLLLLPGGIGTFRELYNPKMKQFLSTVVPKCDNVMTVCTGSGILSNFGWLDGKRATTNKLSFHVMVSYGKKVKWVKEARYVQDGKFFTSSGVAAGTDLSLHVIEQLFGREAAVASAYAAEYVWNEDQYNDPFADSIPKLTVGYKANVLFHKVVLGTMFKSGFAMGKNMLGITSKFLPS